MVFFSIIIPVYNVESWIERCLDSILADQCKDMELILVDDGSTDQSGEICDRYAASNPRVRVIHKTNGGLASARNTGLEAARGEWISFIDSDDWVDKDSFHEIRTLLSGLENRQPDMIKFGYKKIGLQNEREFVPCIPEGFYDRDAIIETLLPVAFGSNRISNSTMHTFILSACTHIYRHAFLNEAGIRFISERRVGSEDFLFLYSLYMRSSCIYTAHRQWYNYDTREGSLTRRYRADLSKQYKRLGYLVFREMKKNELKKILADDFKVFYIGLMYICVMNECARNGNRPTSLVRVRKILKDETLKKCLHRMKFADSKSNIIAGCMRAGTALPLCLIQWSKAGKTI